jgi:hypothetical protein
MEAMGMPDTPASPNRSNHAQDVTVPLRCPLCQGKISITYETGHGSDIRARFSCPHCRQRVQIDLPGLLVPPVQIRRE